MLKDIQNNIVSVYVSDIWFRRIGDVLGWLVERGYIGDINNNEIVIMEFGIVVVLAEICASNHGDFRGGSRVLR